METWEYGKNKKYVNITQFPSKNSISVVSGITENNGVNYYITDVLNENEVYSNELTITTRGEYSGTVFYHNENFCIS